MKTRNARKALIFNLSLLMKAEMLRNGTMSLRMARVLNALLLEVVGAVCSLSLVTLLEYSLLMEFKRLSYVRELLLSLWLDMKTYLLSYLTLVLLYTDACP